MKKLIFLFLLLSVSFSLFPKENTPENKLFGAFLSSYVKKNLSEKGFTALEQRLSETGQDEFAYNLILEFEGNRDSAVAAQRDSLRTNVIFCFTQEDFFENRDIALDFLNFLKNLQKNYDVTVLFSALDVHELDSSVTALPENDKAINGTEIFASSVDDADSSLAIAVRFDKKTKNAIYTGSLKKTTPLYLTERMNDAFFDTRTDFSFEDKFSAIYRLGIVKGEERLFHFFENELPAIEVNFSDSGKALPVLKKFSENYTPLGTEEWDMHYIYLSRANIFKAFFISERTIIISCLSVGILTILILCLFSFTGKNGERQKYEFIKSSYMIPFTIGLSFLSLLLGQKLVSLLSSFINLNPVFLFGAKIVLSMIFISILFAFQEILKFSVTAFVYGYILSVVSIFNIFLFSTRDITLFVIFLIEYIVIYASRSVKKLPVLIIFFVLMALPFLPYAYIIIKSAEDIDLIRTIIAPPAGNLLLAFGIFPFQIMWLKILMFMNIYAGGKGYSMKRIIFNDIVSTAGILLFCFTLIFLISHFIYRPEYRKSLKAERKILNDDKSSLEAYLTKDTFSGMTTNHIKLSSSENAVRYTVNLFGIDSEHPIYDSIYDYTILKTEEGKDYYSFTLPDYPPKEITIDWACEMGTKARVGIEAFYRTENAREFRREERELFVE
ncbi:MAG: hypothetical protein IJ630_03765 [Treponema sp.]|nr:hypothetical protein [Treponema sp.]